MAKHGCTVAAAVCALALSAGAATTKNGALKRDTEKNDWDSSWTTTVKVNRGEEHTFWVYGLTEDTGVNSLEVECEYTYKDDDGDTAEDWVSASERTEVENSAGSFDLYVLLTADDWEYVPASKSSLTFTVKVDGFYDEDVAANNKFTFAHEAGRSAFPGESAPATPAGRRENPLAITLKDIASGQTVAANASSATCTMDGESDGSYYVKTSSLVAGRKYYFGISDGESLTILNPGDGVVEEYEGWDSCVAAYSFVPAAAGSYTLVVAGPAGTTFTLYHAALPALKPAAHDFTDLAVGGTSEAFRPGYMIDPDGAGYDGVIDQRLFRVTGYRKGDAVVFSTEGAGADLLMQLYDSNGNVLAENVRRGDGDRDVAVAWTAGANYAAASAVYVGVCQNLADGEEPDAGEVTLTARLVSLSDDAAALPVTPDPAGGSPLDAAGAVAAEARELGEDRWTNTYVVAARAGVKYRVKARCGAANGLTLTNRVYTLSGARATLLTEKANGLSGSVDPTGGGWLEFTPTANANVYIDVYVAAGGYGAGVGLPYGPYTLTATAAGDYGILKADMKGAPLSLMGWKILSGPGITASKEVFYAPGTSAILPTGSYTLLAQTAAGYAKPDAKGYATVAVKAGAEASEAPLYKYTDSYDPLDDGPDAKAKHPALNKAYAPTRLAPTAAKAAEASRSLWDDDPADWYTVAATAGCWYRFAFASVEGDARISVYGPDNWTNECEYAVLDDPASAVQVCAAARGTYYVKVAHADAASPSDSGYTLSATMANPGVVKFAKTAVAVKDSAAYADLSVSRTAKDGLVRVKFRTEGFQSSAEDAYYVPTNGVLTWAANDMKAQTIRLGIVPNAAWATNKTVRVVLEAFGADDETFDAEGEYVATFAVDAKTGETQNVASVTVSANAKKAPGAVQAADCGNAKKPVYSVVAGGTVEIPFERVSGSDGAVGVKVETVKGTANKSGETDFAPASETFVWGDGEGGRKTLTVSTKAADGDWTASKTFTVKVTALTGKAADGTAYDRPTVAAATVTVNILNDKFADTLANHSKANAAALKARGVAMREGKAGTWFVAEDGSLFAAAASDLTFSLTGPGKFEYLASGAAEPVVEYVAAGAKTVAVKGVTGIDWYEWTPLPAAAAAAPTLDKAVVAAGGTTLSFAEAEGVSYRVYVLAPNAKAERTAANGRVQTVALKLGDPETEIAAPYATNLAANAKYAWRVDSYFEGGTVTNAAKTAWTLTTLAEDAPATPIHGEDAYGAAVDGSAAGAAVSLKQGLKADFTLADETATAVKAVAGTTTALAYKVEAAGTAIGTFTGLATTWDATNGVAQLASVTVTAAATGKLSAKANIGGKAYSFADTGYSALSAESDGENDFDLMTAELCAVQKVGTGAAAQTVTNRLVFTVADFAETNSAAWYHEADVQIRMAALPDAKGSGWQEDVWYEGRAFRDNSKLAAWQSAAAAASGYYTVALTAPGARDGEPQGSGYMTMTLDAKGKARLAGTLADGTAYSASATAAFAEDGSVAVPLYAAKASSVFGGWLSVGEDADGNLVAKIDAPATDLVWNNDDPASTRDGEEGFSLLLQPAGGWYDTVSNLQRAYLESDLSVDLPQGEDALEAIADALALGDAYGDLAFVAQPSGQAVALAGDAMSVSKQTLAKDAATKLVSFSDSANASNVKIAFNRKTGIVAGSFDLWYEGVNAKGAVEQKSIAGLKHAGVLVWTRGDDGYLEDDVVTSGYFLAPVTLKETVETTVGTRTTVKTVTRKWNGSWRFDIKAARNEREWTDVQSE